MNVRCLARKSSFDRQYKRVNVLGGGFFTEKPPRDLHNALTRPALGGRGGVEAGGLRGWEHRFSRTAFAGDENPNAFEHFGRGASAFGQEYVCATGSVIRGDRSGDDHCGQGWVQLLGAAHQFIAIHLRHDEIAEQQIDGAGK